MMRSGRVEAAPGRRHDIDALRILAMLTVFLFHCARFFDPFPWHVKNAEHSFALTLFVGFVDAWAMPLFFVLSGAASWFGLEARSGRGYVIDRIKRLVVPFYTVGIFLLLPPQLYWDQVTNHGLEGVAWKLYPRYFTDSFVTSPSPFFAGFWPGHLWFLRFLFLVSLLALPVLLHLKTGPGRRRIDALAGWCARPGGVFLFAVPLFLVSACSRGFWQGEHTWADLFSFTVFFLIGYVLAADPRFTRSLRRHMPVCLALALAGMACEYHMVLRRGYPYPGGQTFSPPGPYVLFQLVMSVQTWCWLVVLLGAGARFLNRDTRLLAYGNEAVLPFYVLHQTLILLVGVHVVRWSAPIPVKYGVICAAAFTLTMAVYELLVRRFRWMRWLFGMRLPA